MGRIVFGDVVSRYLSNLRHDARDLVLAVDYALDSRNDDQSRRVVATEAHQRVIRIWDSAHRGFYRTIGDLATTGDITDVSYIATQAFCHEVNNILTGIGGYLQLSIISRELDQGDLKKVSDNIGRLLLTINDFERYSKELSSNKFELRPRTTELMPILQRSLAHLGYTGRDGRIVYIDGRPYTGRFVDSPEAVVDPDITGLCVGRELLRNAWKYSPNDGRVDIGFSEKDGEVQWSISDHGIGIRRGDLSKVFDVGYRTNDVDVHGTGLGLPIARKVVEMQGGRLSVNSVHGQGTTFTVALPKSGQLRLPFPGRTPTRRVVFNINLNLVDLYNEDTEKNPQTEQLELGLKLPA